jgi:hypothetical protein
MIREAASAYRLGIFECRNVLNHRTGLVIAAEQPAPLPPIALGEMPAPPSAAPLTEEAKRDLGRLCWCARNDLLSTLIHLPFVSRRDNALAFSAYVERKDGKFLFYYLARLFLYPSESAQWIGWEPTPGKEDG